MSTAGIALVLFIVLFLYVPLVSVGTWIASKIVSATSPTYSTAVVVNLFQLLASAAIFLFGALLMRLAAGDPTRMQLVTLGVAMLAIAIGIMIPAKIYSISAWGAVGLNILSALTSLVVGGVALVVVGMVIGFASMKAPFQDSMEKFQQAQSGASVPGISLFAPSPSPSAPPSPAADNGGDIDGMLNAALHPVGPPPSLSERENIVRTLQQMLRAEHANLPPNDPRAALVYQNQLYRYMLLLEAVKTERKAHPFSEEMANRQAPPP
ncbi:MAG: hypothetical protein P4L99_23675 [Chthoniobacter sp.]|nr:hypothetical protein [Chthoniobacter sp.]